MREHYTVKEIFGPTIQGEGVLTGTPCFFLRLGGCNMWNGKIETRADSQCPYCDTDFFGGTKMDADQIVASLLDLRIEYPEIALVVVTGGEPFLQFDKYLHDKIIEHGFKCQVETNGTIDVPLEFLDQIHSVSVSPKLPRSQIKLVHCNSLKILYPHPNPKIRPEDFNDYPAHVRIVQPIHSLDFGKNYYVRTNERETDSNLRKSIEKVKQLGSGWRLGLQIHKVVNQP